MNARHAAILVISPLLNQSSSLKYSLAKHSPSCSAEEKPFLQELCYGSLRYYPQLDAIITQLISKPLKRKDNDVYAIIMIGIYQLYKMRVAEHAAISETVQLCKTIKKNWATGLVNATLRNFQRCKDELIEEFSANDPYFSFNHPSWFIEKLKANWPDQWQDILDANDDHPPLTLRVNTSKVPRETFSKKLADNGIETSPGLYSNQGLYLSKPTDVTKIEGFEEGLFSVQDEAAQLAAGLLNIQPSDNILDACSAPGGKLMHILELTENSDVRVQGLELEKIRADKIKENFERLNINCELHIADAACKDWWDGELFDKILLDAPCSATGVIRRNPDIKLLRKSEDIHQTAKLQMQILTNLWETLKNGGRLVYATCSIFTQENEKIIQKFLKDNEDASHIKIDSNWGTTREYGKQLFPSKNLNDGFYYAILEKKQRQPL